MGLLDSLAQILPYAIPAAAGAALGGPGLAMVGAGGAAEAQNQNLNKQIEIANLLNESQYRNADLGLRRQEIQSNEALRKQSLQQSKQERDEATDEKKREFGLTDQERKDREKDVVDYHKDSLDTRRGIAGVTESLARARNDEEVRQHRAELKEHITSSIDSAQKFTDKAADDAWKAQGFLKRTAPEGMGGVNYEKFKEDFRQEHLPALLRQRGVTPEAMRAAGMGDDTIADAFPSYNPMSTSGTPAPAAPSAASGKLKSAAKGGGAAATFKTSMPDTPAGHAYHVNGKAYVVKGGVATEVPNG